MMVLAVFAGACSVSLGAAATAAASDYCVAEPACPAGGTNETVAGLQAALEAAEKHVNSGGPDRVLVGAGSYSRSEGFSYSGDPVLVRGAGVGATVLTRPATSGPSVLTLTDAGSTVQGLTVLIPAHSGLSGVTLTAGTMEGDAIEAPSAANPVFALEISGTGVFTHGTIDAASGTGVESRGGEVLHSTIFGGGFGVQALSLSTLRGDRISGGTPIFSYANPLVVEDSLVDLGGTGGHGIEIVGNTNGKALAFLRHVAVVNGKGGTGVLLHAENENATAVLENSIVSGVGTPVLVLGEGAGTTASFSVNYSSFDFAKSEKKMTGGASSTLVAEHMLPTLPSFVSPATGDYHLAPGSPLIDAGTPGALGLGEFTTDIAGNSRIVNGRRDVGPYEYQWRGPAVTATSSKSTTDIGANVSFNGGATTVEPGDPVVGYQWTFDDGTAVPAGAVAERAFLKSGLHTATLTATDAAGLSSTATVSVTVKAELPVCLIEGGCCEGLACPAGSRSIKGLAVKPLAFKAALRGGAIGAARGAQVTYTVTGAVGMADFVVKRVLAGVTSAAGSCVKPHKGLKGRTCARYGPAQTSFPHISPAGANHFHLTGRTKGKKLPPGRYMLIGHLASQPHGPFVTAAFRILR